MLFVDHKPMVALQGGAKSSRLVRRSEGGNRSNDRMRTIHVAAHVLYTGAQRVKFAANGADCQESK